METPNSKLTQPTPIEKPLDREETPKGMSKRFYRAQKNVNPSHKEAAKRLLDDLEGEEKADYSTGLTDGAIHGWNLAIDECIKKSDLVALNNDTWLRIEQVKILQKYKALINSLRK